MTFTQTDLLNAAAFAADRHATQCRKGDAAEPYINHLIEVAGILSATDVRDDFALLMAGLLHDTLEDTDTTPDELEGRFGADVSSLVMEATDDKSLKKEARKRLQVETAPLKSARARLLKTADKISNLSSIAVSPPSGWDSVRMGAYVDWSEQVVAGCLQAPAGFPVPVEAAAAGTLEQVFGQAVATARRAIAAKG